MKSDADIQTDVIQELKWDPSICSELIGVSVEKGAVTLSGKAPSYFEKFAAERAAKRVAGVRAVVEKIEIDLPADKKRGDDAIAQAILNNFFWNIQVPEKDIQVEVEKGFVTLSGNVTWAFEKNAAEKAVRKVTGVLGISNLIHVDIKQAKPTEVKKKIEDALKRNAELEAKKISVEVVGDKVILEGTVHSHAESEDARWAAWSAIGVTTVDNRLQIVP
jgi:osmotically-inducible protein OsmY